MKYVLDSNVALKWVLPETDDDKAIRIRDAFEQGIHDLISPDIFPNAAEPQSESGDGAPSYMKRRFPVGAGSVRRSGLYDMEVVAKMRARRIQHASEDSIEVAHSLARAERRGEIRLGEGSRKLADVFTYMPALHPSLALLPRAFALASQARIGVYDCLYVILAEREGANSSRLMNGWSRLSRRHFRLSHRWRHCREC